MPINFYGVRFRPHKKNCVVKIYNAIFFSIYPIIIACIISETSILKQRIRDPSLGRIAILHF